LGISIECEVLTGRDFVVELLSAAAKLDER
jgi:hypothetical protein